jgi:hypothetical protein
MEPIQRTIQVFYSAPAIQGRCAAIRIAKADRHPKEAYEEIAANDARRVANR